MRKLVLASASPRRRELLAAAGIACEARPVDVDESLRPGEAAADYVGRLAEDKARAGWRPGELTLGADTTVLIDSLALGKPADAADAARMLRLLSGREHEVLTGCCLFDGDLADVAVETTRVRFAPLSDAEIAAYVAAGESMDKAGAYGIQGVASRFVERVEGCWFNVVGLPIARVWKMLRAAGWPPDVSVPNRPVASGPACGTTSSARC